MRVHELAKATQLESKEILAIAKRHRIAVKPNPSANIEDKDIRKLMPAIDKYKAELHTRQEEEKRHKEEERLRKEEERRRKEEERRRQEEDRRRQAEEDRRRAEEEERQRKEEQVRLEAQRRADEERQRREEEERKAREEAERKRAEEAEALRRQNEALAASRPKPTQRPYPGGGSTERPDQARFGQQQHQGPSQGQGQGQGGYQGQGQGQGGYQGQGQGQGGYQGRGGQGQGGYQGRGQGQGGYQGRGQGQGGYQGRGGQGQGGYQGRGGQGQGGYQGRGGQGQGGYQGRGGQGQGGYQGQGAGYQGRQGGQGQGQGGYQGRGGQGGQGGYQGQGGGYQGRQGGQGQGQGGYQGRGGQGGQGGYQGRGGQGQGGYQGRGPGQGGYQGRGPGQGGYQGRGGQGQGGYQGRPPRDRDFQRGSGAPQQGREEGGALKPALLTEANLPQIGVMRLDKSPRGGRNDRDKRGQGRQQKQRNKPAPTRLFELDEDMTVTSRQKRPVRGGVRHAGGDHGSGANAMASGQGMAQAEEKKITIRGEVTVAQFAEKVGVSPMEVIKKLLMLGEVLNLNQNLTPDLMELLAQEFSVTLEVIRESDEYDVAQYLLEDDPEKMKRRPPVVTIMGHVDHGKTTLLDRIRKSNVVEGEFGGITQHIGAYHVSTSKGDIVFLDTPGHEAFTAMRARGASVTDLVILVVAANDGFKPQTIEAIHHSQAAKVPLVVAVNKIDIADADPARVRQEALLHGLVPEELGGDVIFVDISAKQGRNIDQLLEMVALQAEILDLKADPDRPALGTIVESHIDPQRGAVATVLVQKGTLRAGDFFVAGDISGRVRAMLDDRGRTIKEAGPSFPVEILGLTGSPSAGETFLVMPDERVAREVASKREVRRRLAGLAPVHQKHVTLEGLHDYIEEGKVKDLNIILKGDVQGSIEAVSQSLEKLSTTKVRIRILHTAVGGINESDVNLAVASDAIIVGFNVRPEATASTLAEQEGVEIKLYRIIYDLLEDVKAAMVGMLEPRYQEKVIGHAEIRQVYKISRIGTIAGCYVRDGEIIRDSKVRIVRDNIVVYDGTLNSLKRFKEDAKRVPSGMECGMSVENYNDLKEGDIIEAYQMEQIAATLEE